MDSAEFRAIELLIYRYADWLDRGEYDRAAALFDDADFYIPGKDQPLSRAAGNRMGEIFREWMLACTDSGAAKARHVTTNLIIEADAGGRARSQAYVTVYQIKSSQPPHPIMGARYRDRFERVEGVWRFRERRIEE